MLYPHVKLMLFCHEKLITSMARSLLTQVPSGWCSRHILREVAVPEPPGDAGASQTHHKIHRTSRGWKPGKEKVALRIQHRSHGCTTKHRAHSTGLARNQTEFAQKFHKLWIFVANLFCSSRSLSRISNFIVCFQQTVI